MLVCTQNTDCGWLADWSIHTDTSQKTGIHHHHDHRQQHIIVVYATDMLAGKHRHQARKADDRCRHNTTQDQRDTPRPGSNTQIARRWRCICDVGVGSSIVSTHTHNVYAYMHVDRAQTQQTNKSNKRNYNNKLTLCDSYVCILFCAFFVFSLLYSIHKP